MPILLILLLLLSQAHAQIRAGAATESITPPTGIPMAGYYHKRESTGVHDDLFARALVLEHGGTKVALVSLDLVSTRRTFVEEARRLIEERTGIPASHVMISATHTHTAPVLAGGRLYDTQGANEPLSLEYSKGLPDRISKSVEAANAKLADCELLAAEGSEGAITFNRRFHMKDGSVGWNPGKLNPDIIKPAGPIDPAVPVVFLRSAEEHLPLAAYINYSVHLDNVGGTNLSADLPFTVTESLRKAVGDGLVTLYTSGACGDLNHVDVTWAEPQKGDENAARMGTILAGEVLKTWRHLEPVTGKLQVRSRTVELELPEFDAATIAESEKVLETSDDSSRHSFMRLVHAHKVLDVAERKGAPFEVEVQVITLGDRLAWVALPGEIFVELGLDLKTDSPFGQTMVAELANGSIGYIPCSRAYRHGNYEVVSARCAKGSGERLVAAALDLLAECYQAVEK
jgi:hypothetical protein